MIIRSMVVALLLVSCVTTPETQEPKLATAWNFDWDDNIMFMPTDIVLFHTQTNKELMMSTGAFAVHRSKVGKGGTYEGQDLASYEIRTTDRFNSFRYFRDSKTGENYFLEDLKKAFAQDESKWQGPSWDAFVYVLSRPETARVTSIITARGHSPKAVIEGLKYMQQQGMVKYLVPEDRIFAVSNPKVVARFGVEGGAANPSAIKAEVMKSLLDNMNKQSIAEDTLATVGPDGTSIRRQYTWGFSDDDYGNYAKAVEVLSAEVKKDRWPQVKIVVFYTGTHDKRYQPMIRVIKPDGNLRERVPAESREGYVTELEQRSKMAM